MGDNFSIKDLMGLCPEVVNENNEIDYKKFCVFLAQELSDIQDQLKEKDYQILRITERLDNLGV